MTDAQRNDRYLLAGWTVKPSLLRLDHEQHGERRLSPRAMSVLMVLADARGEVVKKYDLLDAVWGNADVSDGMLSQTILELRNALDDDAKDPRVIETIRRVGFRLIPAVQPITEDEAPKSAAPRSRAYAALFAVAILAVATWLLLHQSPPQPASEEDKPRLMVLPFEDRSPVGDYEYFAAGIADEIAIHLAGSAELRLVADRAVLALANKGMTPDAIANSVAADMILSGSVQRRNGTMRLVVRLTDVERGEEMWITRFERPGGDVFAIQDQVAQSIAALVLRGERLTPRASPTDDLTAYDVYLQGRDSQRRLSPDATAEAIRLFDYALELDPGFALARARLAESLAIQGYIFQAGRSALARSLNQAELALQADPELADGLYAKALALAGLGRSAAAYREIQAATRLRPNHSDALFLAGSLAEARGDLVNAVRDYRLALRLDPTLPRTVALGRLYMLLGDPTNAVEVAERGHLLAPGYPTLYLAFLMVFLDNAARAEELCGQALAMGLPRSRNLCGFVALTSGRETDARELLEADWNDDPRVRAGPFTFAASATHLAMLDENPQPLLDESEAITLSAIADGNDHWSLRYNLAAVASLRGEVDTAFEWLDEAYNEGFRDARLLEIDPAFDVVRTAPQYNILLNRLNADLDRIAIELGMRR
ncbi:MAG: winged helix-turn-helix domain-containing protein [Woeseiaceae bacterium]|nr:winged helix-turn-helix domain-containing protein [Woeseiaceae bacterium]